MYIPSSKDLALFTFTLVGRVAIIVMAGLAVARWVIPDLCGDSEMKSAFLWGLFAWFVAPVRFTPSVESAYVLFALLVSFLFIWF